VRVGWAAAVLVACFGLLGTVRLLKLSTSPALAVGAQPTTSAAPPMLSALATPAEPRPEESPQQEQRDQPPPAPLPAATALAVPAAAPAATGQVSSGLGTRRAAEPEGALDASTGDASDALALKHEAQEALEHSKVSLALEVGRRAVDADPTDAETWLILGAAYIQRGRYTEARGCFKSCVEQATQGPRSECKALLR
jgi:Flp pilus assembly protein TadD